MRKYQHGRWLLAAHRSISANSESVDRRVLNTFTSLIVLSMSWTYFTTCGDINTISRGRQAALFHVKTTSRFHLPIVRRHVYSEQVSKMRLITLLSWYSYYMSVVCVHVRVWWYNAKQQHNNNMIF